MWLEEEMRSFTIILSFIVSLGFNWFSYAAESTKPQDVPPPQPVIVMGNLSKDAIAQEITRYMGNIQNCYEEQIKAKPKLAGKIVVQFIIESSGSVSSSKTQETTMNDELTEACINHVFQKMKFPPTGGGIVEVAYPLTFGIKK